ncbi:MAG: NusG domain II-containing protein [Treponema sp.]|jgi:hypothetical protein|nr:NusG domain II-containing protein [Treponema sp.]
MKSLVKIPDIFIILVVASITFYTAYNVYMKPQGGSMILIRGQGSEWTFPVDADETIIVTGFIGNTTVRIQNNHAWVESSPCRNQTCVATGLISRQGQWAACLPNNVLLMIQGIRDDGIDVIAR